MNKLVDPLSTRSLIFGIFSLIGLGALIMNGWAGYKSTVQSKANQHQILPEMIGIRDDYQKNECLTDFAFQEYNRMNGMYTNDGLVLRK